MLKRRGCQELILQIGAGEEPTINEIDFKITWYRFKPSIADDIIRADLVIAHCGAGTCLDVLSAQKPLLVVANEDLMDSHQDELASKLYSLNYLAYSRPEEIAKTLSELNVSLLEPYKSGDPSVFALFINSVVGVQS